METIVLAGGYAKRLWPITLHRPKPLLPIAGIPILDHLLPRLPKGKNPIVSVNQRFEDQFRAWAQTAPRPVELAVEDTRAEEEKLGAVGALHQLVVERGIAEDLLVVGGDNLIELDFAAFVGVGADRPRVALCDLGDPAVARKRYGVAIVEDGRIVDFEEKPERPSSALAATACYMFPRRVLPLLETFVATSPAGQDAPGYFLSWLVEREAVDGFVFSGGWYDIGGREAYIEANQRLAHASSWIHPEAQVRGAQVERSVVLGRSILEDCVLEGCVVDAGAEISGVALRDALVGSGTVLRGG